MCFDEFVEQVVCDMEYQWTNVWYDVQGYNKIKGGGHETRAWLQDWVAYVLVTLPYIDNPDREWA